MTKILRLILLLAIGILLSSCLSSGTDIIVNKDGSGEIIHTFQIMKEYMTFMNLEEQGISDPNMIDKESLIERAATIGEGVTFSKVEPVSESSLFAGYKAYYTFTDINNVKTSSTPMTTPGDELDTSEWISFEFKKGGKSQLTIITPHNEDSAEMDNDDVDSDSSEMENEGMIQQLKQIYKTMHFWLKISVNGNINKTNAYYSDQSEITILDMNFEKVVENDELFKHITSGENPDLEEVRDELEKIGVKIDDQERIEISFK